MTVFTNISPACPPQPIPTTHYGRPPGNSRAPPQIISPIRRPQGGWARSPIEKDNLFAKYLSEVFKPHSSTAAADVTEYLHTPFQMSPPIEPFTSAEIIEAISRLNPKKAAGQDLIGNKAIKELPVKGIAPIASIFNAILRLEHFP